MFAVEIMDNRNRLFGLLHAIIAALFLLLTGFMFLLNTDETAYLVMLSCGFAALTGFRHYYASRWRNNLLRWLLPCLEGALLILIQTRDQSNTALGLYTLFIMDIAIDYEYIYGILFAAAGYIAYMYAYTLGLPEISMANRIMIYIIGAVQVTLYTGFAFLTKRYSRQNELLQRTTGELKAKMLDLEQLAVIKERNRIAGEIHNTVGHQLTTALVQIEAAQMLLDREPDEAKMRLSIIKDQVKEGLHALRKSIHAIDADHEYQHFRESAERLFDQVRTHAGVSVDAALDDLEGVNIRLKKALYHMMMESITNGIRHGHCSRVKIRLVNESGQVCLSSFNNGIVPDNIDYGYGLSQLKEMVQSLSGSLSMLLNDDGWFGLVAQLPVYRQEGEL